MPKLGLLHSQGCFQCGNQFTRLNGLDSLNHIYLRLVEFPTDNTATGQLQIQATLALVCQQCFDRIHGKPTGLDKARKQLN